MDIKLDAKALEALFPEGTEARANLQQCVLTNFSNKIIRNIGESKMATIINNYMRENNIVTDHTEGIKDAVSEYLGTQYSISSHKRLVPETISMLRRQIRISTSEIIEKEVSACIKETVEEKLENIRVDIGSRIDDKIDQLTETFDKDLIRLAIDNRVQNLRKDLLLLIGDENVQL